MQKKCSLWGVVYESNIEPKPVANFFHEIDCEPEKKDGIMVRRKQAKAELNKAREAKPYQYRLLPN